VMLRLRFDLRGIARGQIGPGTVIIDSTPKVISAAPFGLTGNGRNKISDYPLLAAPRRTADERPD
jgi:hypothetical protein